MVAERLALRVRKRSGQTVDKHPDLVARALGFEVVYRSDLPAAWPGISFYGCPTLTVRKCGYAPREAASTAHELAEVHIAEKLPVWHEEFCQGFAAALILPAVPFMRSAFSCRFDLARLRRIWRWASWEMIGRRAAELSPDARFLAWLDEHPTRGEAPLDCERAAVAGACLPRAGRCMVAESGWVAQAWHLTAKGEEARAVSLALKLPT